jgi:hypothetical protein
VFWSLRTVIILLLATALLYLIAILPSTPYHIRELFGSSPSLPQALLFALIVLFALGPPAVLGLQLVRLSRGFVWLFPSRHPGPCGGRIPGISLRHANRQRSRPDWRACLGDSQRTGTSRSLRRAISDGVSADLRRHRIAVRHHARPCPSAGALVVAVSTAVSRRQLLDRRGQRGHRQHHGALAFGRGSVGLDRICPLVAEFGLCRIGGGRARRRPVEGHLATLFAVAIFLPLSFGILFSSLEQQIGGPQSTLSALDFLLSARRTDYGLGMRQLLLRYSLAYLATILLLACSQYPAWLAYSTRRFKSISGASGEPAVGVD